MFATDSQGAENAEHERTRTRKPPPPIVKTGAQPLRNDVIQAQGSAEAKDDAQASLTHATTHKESKMNTQDNERRIRSAKKRIDRLEDAISHIDEAYVASRSKKLLAVKCDLQDEKVQLKNKIAALKRQPIAMKAALAVAAGFNGKRFDI